MRYEVMRLLQFVFSLSLMFAAFMGGIYVGWRRWGRPGPVDHTREDAAVRAPAEAPEPGPVPTPARRDLFAPELSGSWSPEMVDLRVAPAPARLGLPTPTNGSP